MTTTLMHRKPRHPQPTSTRMEERAAFQNPLRTLFSVVILAQTRRGAARSFWPSVSCLLAHLSDACYVVTYTQINSHPMIVDAASIVDTN